MFNRKYNIPLPSDGWLQFSSRPAVSPVSARDNMAAEPLSIRVPLAPTLLNLMLSSEGYE